MTQVHAPHRIATLVLAAVLATPAAAVTLTGIGTAADGDTLELGTARVRLDGIDAPELSQRCRRADSREYACGRAARDALRGLLRDRPLRCEVVATDRYERPVARCEAQRVGDIGRWLVRRGHALAFRRFSERYVDDERYAEARKLGVWQGRFDTPWDHRKQVRTRTRASASEQPPDPGCRIKGNVSSREQRIYHMPGDRHYARTRISTSRGERWFCNEREAQAAGWRRARR